MEKIIIIFITIFSFTFTLNATSTKELLETISNTKSKLQYFFFIKDSKAFLVKETIEDDKKYKVWNYTRDRKWQPISNTQEYDGFKSSINHFDTININKENKTISFGNIINYNNELPFDTSTKTTNVNNDILPLLQTIENKTISIGWYFWIKNNESFLFREDNEKGIKIWNYTQDRKWKPLYNTDKFDGFNKAGKTLKSVEFNTNKDTDTFFINIGDININKNAFIFTIQTDDSKYHIFTDANYVYNYSVDCDSDRVLEAENLNGNYTCEYDKNGTYDISIEGIYPSRGIGSDSSYYENNKILDIKQWGNIKWKDMSSAFANAVNMTMSAQDKPDFSQTERTNGMFSSARKFNKDISHWDVSSVTNMRYMFARTELFNQDISKWNTSSVTDMSGMFYKADSFNQDISKWNTSSVTDMDYMFADTERFNQDISKLDVSKVTNMEHMFHQANSFNQNISNWDVSSVKDMNKMFFEAGNFNQNISKWNTSSVTDMNRMFLYADSFNQDISKWNTSSVTDMSGMFGRAKSFNQDIGNWDVSKVTKMEYMFSQADSFNQDLGNWDVSNTKNMYSMFQEAKEFNQDLTKWEINKNTNTGEMFKDATSMEEKNKPEGI